MQSPTAEDADKYQGKMSPDELIVQVGKWKDLADLSAMQIAQLKTKSAVLAKKLEEAKAERNKKEDELYCMQEELDKRDGRIRVLEKEVSVQLGEIRQRDEKVKELRSEIDKRKLATKVICDQNAKAICIWSKEAQQEMQHQQQSWNKERAQLRELVYRLQLACGELTQQQTVVSAQATATALNEVKAVYAQLVPLMVGQAQQHASDLKYELGQQRNCGAAVINSMQKAHREEVKRNQQSYEQTLSAVGSFATHQLDNMNERLAASQQQASWLQAGLLSTTQRMIEANEKVVKAGGDALEVMGYYSGHNVSIDSHAVSSVTHNTDDNSFSLGLDSRGCVLS